MKTSESFRLSGAASAAGILLCVAGCSSITHVPPGQSVAFSLAPKAEFISGPPVAVAVAGGDDPQDELYYGPAVEPELPEADFSLPDELAEVDDAAAYVVQGSEHLAAGNYRDAVVALKKAVTLAPSFSAAWRDLALAYENLGESENATEAFRNYEKYAAH